MWFAWQSQTARLLAVDSRRVRAWLAGERSIPRGIWKELADELRRRGTEACRLADEIDEAA